MSNIYFRSRVNESESKELIEDGIQSFYKIIDSFSSQGNFYEYFIRLTEASFVNLFTQALVKSFGFNRFNILSELGVSKNENQWGRVDLVIEDFRKETFFVLEAKSFWSNENEPKSDHWSEDATKKYYDRLFDQANSYIKVEDLFREKRVNLIALTFSRVEIFDNKLIESWKFSKIGNDEYYAFKTYSHNNKTIGLSVYGKVRIYRDGYSKISSPKPPSSAQQV